MQIILFEDNQWSHFLPLCYTRPVGELRIGIMTIAEKYYHLFQSPVAHDTRVELREIFPPAKDEDQLRINARLLPDNDVVKAIAALKPNQTLRFNEVNMAQHMASGVDGNEEIIQFEGNPKFLKNLTDLFALNGHALQFDFELLRSKSKSASLHESNIVIGSKENVFISESAKAYASTFNTLDGPIFIDEDAEVMEGSHIRGPFYLGKHSTLKMASKVYGPTTIGPHCKVGGEVSNSVILGYSNKAHDGFIGNSVIGEWCNLGADTNTSNLKNNYSPVRIWSYADNSYMNTGLTFCGLIMGDHSKCGINTMFNTGTVVGVSANIFGGGFPPKHVPSFAWGGSEGFQEYELSKAFATMTKVYERRSLVLSHEMSHLLTEIFNNTKPQRLNPSQSQE